MSLIDWLFDWVSEWLNDWSTDLAVASTLCGARRLKTAALRRHVRAAGTCDDGVLSVVLVTASVAGETERPRTPLVKELNGTGSFTAHEGTSVPVVSAIWTERCHGCTDWNVTVALTIGSRQFGSRSPTRRLWRIVAILSAAALDIGHTLSSTASISTPSVLAIKRGGREVLMDTFTNIVVSVARVTTFGDLGETDHDYEDW